MKQFKVMLDATVEAATPRLAIQAALSQIEVTELNGVIDIYTDGSFTDAGCFGGFIAFKDDIELMRDFRKIEKESYLPARNVAGECVAAMVATQWAKKNGHMHILIHHDYEGVAKWVTGEWGCKKPVTRDYKMYMEKMKTKGIEIEFEWVRGHNGDTKNEAIDEYISAVAGRRK